jgi:hypothetical protein
MLMSHHVVLFCVTVGFSAQQRCWKLRLRWLSKGWLRSLKGTAPVASSLSFNWLTLYLFIFYLFQVQSRLPAVLDNSLRPGGAGWEPVLGVLLHVDVPSALVLTPLLSLTSFRLTWESARRLPSLIVGLPLLCSPLRLTIHVISVSGNQTRV